MRYLLIALLFLVPTLVKAEPVTLTVQEAGEVLAGCMALDGHDRMVKDGERERVVREPYKFGSGFLLAIAKDTVKLRDIVTAYQTARNAKIMELSEGKGSVDPKSDAGTKLAVADAEMLATKQTVDLVMIGSKELKLDPPEDNPIPPSVLANLSKIIVDK